MKITKCSLGLLAALPVVGGCDQARFAVVEEGTSSAVIEAPDDPQVRDDIAFFTNAVMQMTGVGVGVEKVGVGGGGNRIIFDVREADILHEDEYEVAFPDKRTMRIAGTAHGCRWALNALLEEAGVVFCLPGAHGTHWPACRDLAFARTPRKATASLRIERNLYQEDPDWQRAMNGKKQKGVFFWSNIDRIFPIEKYGKEPWCSKIMPERKGCFYSDAARCRVHDEGCFHSDAARCRVHDEGKRVCPLDPHTGWQACYASQACVDEAIRNVCAYLRQHPDEKVYSLAVNDLEGYCECDGCRELNGGFEKKNAYLGCGRFVNHSPSYYHWVNAVVRGVRKEFPHTLFGVFAYCGVTDPPPFKLEPGVVPQVCFDIQQLSDPAARDARERLMADWSKKASAVGIWDYAFGLPSYDVPRIYFDEQEHFFSFKRTICPNLEDFFTEGMISRVVSEVPKRYLYYRLAWDVSRKADAELKRWSEACVGVAAAGALLAYYGLWNDFWHSDKLRQSPWYKAGCEGVYFPYGRNDYLFALDDALAQRAANLMADVVAAANRSGTPDQRKRAEYLKHVDDYMRVRQLAGCAGFTDSNGQFASVDDAIRFVKALPEIEAAEERIVSAREQVFADARESPSGRLEERLATFRRVSNENLPMLLNRALAFAQTSPEMDQLFRTTFPAGFSSEAISKPPSGCGKMPHLRRGDILPPQIPSSGCGKMPHLRRGGILPPQIPNLAVLADRTQDDEAWTRTPRGLAAARVMTADGKVRYAVTMRDAKQWQVAIKIVPGLKPHHNYIGRMRVTNPTKRSLTMGLQVNTMSPALRPRDQGQTNGVTVPPGESRWIAVYTKAHHEGGLARIVISVSDLGSDTVYVDELTLCEVGNR